jgi:uncharacterized protein
VTFRGSATYDNAGAPADARPLPVEAGARDGAGSVERAPRRAYLAGMFDIEEHRGGVRFAVRVQPRASRSEVAGAHGGALRVRLTAPPVEGRANEALVRFLAEALGVRAGAVRLLAGAAGRTKRVEVDGVSAAAVRRLLGA